MCSNPYQSFFYLESEKEKIKVIFTSDYIFRICENNQYRKLKCNEIQFKASNKNYLLAELFMEPLRI